ncbi:MAG: ABC transporter ATP-binding protein [Planctomycetota bacterium]
MADEQPQLDTPDELTALEQELDKPQKKRRFTDLFKAETFRDLKLYGRLLKFLRPSLGSLVLTFTLSFLVGIFQVTEIWIVTDGLKAIIGNQATTGKHAKDTEKTPAPAHPSAAGGEKHQPAAAKEAAPQPALKDIAKNLNPDSFFEMMRKKIFRLDKPPETDAEKRHLLAFMVIALIVVVIIEQVMRYSQEVRMAGVMRRVVMDIRLAVFAHVIGMSLRFHQRHHTAKLISRITHELNAFGAFLTTMLVDFARELFTLIGLIAWITYLHGSFFFAVIAFAFVSYVPVRAIGKKLRKGERGGQDSMGEIFSVLQEALQGNKIVKAFGTEEKEIARFRATNRSYFKSVMRMTRLRSRTEPMVAVIGAAGLAALMYFGGLKVITGQILATDFFALILALTRAVASVRQMGRMSNIFQTGLAAADRVALLLNSRSEIVEKPDARAINAFQHGIEFREVWFSYLKNRPVLQDMSLHIRKGEVVAIVGPSGAGKSTLVDLIPRFYDVERGQITIDGIDVRDLELKSLRKLIGIVSQETVLFSHTIRENIAYGKPGATDDEVRAAAIAANAHDFIQRKPDGYDTVVGERGNTLSGGERQRLAIARALLKDPPIMILDEATSSLDSESEALVQAALNRLMQSRTVIVIAHRLSTVRRADRIVVLNKHRIAEFGTHEELLAKQGMYARLHALQTGEVDFEELANQVFGRVAAEAAKA